MKLINLSVRERWCYECVRVRRLLNSILIVFFQVSSYILKFNNNKKINKIFIQSNKHKKQNLKEFFGYNFMN